MKVIVGGKDKRLMYLAQLLREGGYPVIQTEGTDCEVSELVRVLEMEATNDVVYVAGKIPKQVKAALKEREVAFVDAMTDSEVTAFNAIATAEGAIAEAILLSPWNLAGAKTLVLGYGCCGSVLAGHLKDWGAEVTVVARRSDIRQLIRSNHLNALSMGELEEHIGDFVYIFNSIPSLVLNAQMLKHVKKDAVILDIASKPGGVDYEAAGTMQITAKLSLAIPGRIAPKSSAEKLFEMLKKRYKINQKEVRKSEII